MGRGEQPYRVGDLLLKYGPFGLPQDTGRQRRYYAVQTQLHTEYSQLANYLGGKEAHGCCARTCGTCSGMSQHFAAMGRFTGTSSKGARM